MDKTYKKYHTSEAIHTRFDEFEQTLDEGKVQWRSENEVDSWISGLNALIDEAEAQMMSGDVLGGEIVHDSMRNYIKSMAV